MALILACLRCRKHFPLWCVVNCCPQLRKLLGSSLERAHGRWQIRPVFITLLRDIKPSLLPFSGDSLLIHPSITEGTNPLSVPFDADHVTLSVSLLSGSLLYTAVLDYAWTPIDLEFRGKRAFLTCFRSSSHKPNGRSPPLKVKGNITMYGLSLVGLHCGKHT